MDIDQIPQELIIARGRYATVRSAHEEALKDLQRYCGQLGSIASQILRAAQPDRQEAEPVDISGMFDAGRTAINLIEMTVTQVQSLAVMKSKLKPQAWGK